MDLTNTLELSFLYQDRIRIVLGTTNDLDYKIKWAWEMVTPGQTSDSLGEEERGTLDVSSRGRTALAAPAGARACCESTGRNRLYILYFYIILEWLLKSNLKSGILILSV